MINIKNYNKALAEIEKSKAIIGKERDKIREIYDEIETILECLNEANEDFETAKDYFTSGIEKLSEQV